MGSSTPMLWVLRSPAFAPGKKGEGRVLNCYREISDHLGGLALTDLKDLSRFLYQKEKKTSLRQRPGDRVRMSRNWMEGGGFRGRWNNCEYSLLLPPQIQCVLHSTATESFTTFTLSNPRWVDEDMIWIMIWEIILSWWKNWDRLIGPLTIKEILLKIENSKVEYKTWKGKFNIIISEVRVFTASDLWVWFNP